MWGSTSYLGTFPGLKANKAEAWSHVKCLKRSLKTVPQTTESVPRVGTINHVSRATLHLDQLGVHSSTGTGKCRAATSVSKVAAVVATRSHCAPAILGRNQRSVTKQCATAENVLEMAGTSAHAGVDHHTSYRVSPPVPANLPTGSLLLPCSEVLARQSNDYPSDTV